MSRPTTSPLRRPVALGGIVVATLALVVAVVLLVGRPVAEAATRDAGIRLSAAAPASSASAVTGRSTTIDPAEQAAARNELNPVKVVVLGVIEGFTEFLPISSTGHLLVAERLLGVGATDATKEAADTYAIVIQGGAILAVLVLYWRRVLEVLQGLVGRSDEGRRLLFALVVAFLPAAVVGLLLEKKIKDVLFGPWPIIAAWVVGGAVILWVSTKGWERKERVAPGLESITLPQALIIGLAQVLALWPGTSRSLVTIVAAVLVGLSLAAAVEFSFLLGLVTLGAATALDMVKSGGTLFDTYGVANPVLGFLAAFVAAVVAVKFLVAYLQRHSLAVFGWYRFAVAAVAIGLIAAGKL
ncbi:MAG: undecaprenyl-diphosphate phosphatase [Acidimicrobiales bacterium]